MKEEYKPHFCEECKKSPAHDWDDHPHRLCNQCNYKIDKYKKLQKKLKKGDCERKIQKDLDQD